MTSPQSAPKGPKRRRQLSRTTWASLIATLLLMAVGAGLFFVPPKAAPVAPSSFDAQGHRGARGLAPENTLPGFRRALAVGVTTLEMDVGLTADGIPVVIHDRRLSPDLARGPDGTWIAAPGPVIKAMTLAELQRFDVGRAQPSSRVAERFAEQQGLDGVMVPTLAEVLALGEALGGGTLRYNIETKISPLEPDTSPDPAALTDAILADIESAGAMDRASLQSFDWRSLALARERAPTMETVHLTAERDWLDNLERGRPGASPWTAGWDLDDFEGSVPAAVARAGGKVWSPYFRDLRDGDIAEARGLGLKVVVWTVNEPEDMARLITAGVDGIITDYPDRLRDVMKQAGMALPAAIASP